MSELSESAAEALRDAVGAEHAALWVYGLASAFLGEARTRSAADEATADHHDQRNTAERALRDANLAPPPEEPAYRLPKQVTDQSSAIRALITAEEDCQVGWRAVLENTEDAALRRTALDGLTTASTRSARWRSTIGEHPAVTAFPGRP